MNTFDGQVRAAHTGESRIEVDKNQVRINPGVINKYTYINKEIDKSEDVCVEDGGYQTRFEEELVELR